LGMEETYVEKSYQRYGFIFIRTAVTDKARVKDARIKTNFTSEEQEYGGKKAKGGR